MDSVDWKEELGWGGNELQDLRLLAYDYQREGKYADAIILLEAIMVLQSDDVYDYQALGALYLQTNQPSRAIEYLDQALSIKGRHLPSLLNKAKALLLLGDRAKGLKLAKALTRTKNEKIANGAEALILAYQEEPEQLSSHSPLSDCSKEGEIEPAHSSAPSQESASFARPIFA